jgi:predicted esterase
VQRRVKQFQAAGINIEWHEFAKAHTIAGIEELDLIRNFVLRRKTAV